MIDVALLGTGGMMPMPGRFLTSLYARLNGKALLIDCGEATQISLKILGWGFRDIDAILFTHFHADHISGLPGMLLAIGNSDRDEPLTLIGPQGLAAVVKGLRVICPVLPFDINVIELPRESGELESLTLGVCGFDVRACNCTHAMPTVSYSLTLNRAGRFDVDRARAAGVPMRVWNTLQKQGEAVYDGVKYTADMVMGAPRKGLKVTYCTDSRPNEAIPRLAAGSDLFVCEGLYGDNDLLEKARDHRHMIFAEAAAIAKKAGVSQLWLTHYSPAMTRPAEFLHNAAEIFPNSVAAYDRINTTLKFEED